MEVLMKKILIFLFFTTFLFGNSSDGYRDLSLEDALSLIKEKNLEINVAKFEERIKEYEIKVAMGYHLGKLDLTQSAIRSNDAGNVFGFKLKNREATFNDFGFDEFLAWQMGGGKGNVLGIEPKNLNFPQTRNYYETKLSYMVPLYTGGKLTKYTEITKSLKKLATLDRKKITSAKIYELKKSFYDVSLLNSFHKNLTIIIKNIEKLEATVEAMIEEGYAKKVDLYEVQAKKSNIVRMINQVESNRELLYQFLGFLLNYKVISIKDGYENPPLPTCSIDDMVKSNLDIKKAKTGLKITNNMVAVEKSAYKPQVGFFAEYGSSDDKFLNDFRKKEFYTVGLQVKMNLFNGLIDKNRIEKARTENLKLQQQVILAQNGIKLKISKIMTEIKNFNFHIDSLRQEIKLSKTIYNNYLGRYREKLVSINDVIIKQSQDIERVLKLKEVQNKRNQKIFELEKIANRGDV